MLNDTYDIASELLAIDIDSDIIEFSSLFEDVAHCLKAITNDVCGYILYQEAEFVDTDVYIDDIVKSLMSASEVNFDAVNSYFSFEAMYNKAFSSVNTYSRCLRYFKIAETRNPDLYKGNMAFKAATALSDINREASRYLAERYGSVKKCDIKSIVRCFLYL